MFIRAQNTFSLQMGLRVRGLGRTEKHGNRKRDIIRKRHFQSFGLVYIIEGEGFFDSKQAGRIDIHKGDVLLFTPDVIHSYGPSTDSQWSEFWFVFDGFLAERYLQNGLFDPTKPVVHLGVDTRMLARCTECLRFAEQKRKGYYYAISKTFYGILYDILHPNFKTQHMRSSNTAIINEITKAMLDSVSEKKFDIKRYAKKYSMSYSSIRKFFKATTGFSPNAYFTNLKIKHAATLLRTTEKLVKEIARELGFDDPYYFSRWFAKHEFASPNRFRELIRIGRK